jgi:hypothetical protein
MDPYLENPEIFPDLHSSLNFCLREALQSRLAPPYFAVIGRRAWIEVSLRYIEPDVHVLRHSGGSRSSAGGVAVAYAGRSQPKVVHVPHDERKQEFVEVYARQGSEKRLVTVIEVLSLGNKTPGEHGRDLYLRKQQELLNSQVHLIEIDLLRAGEHTTAVPLQRAIQEAGPFDYHVCAHQFDNLEDYFVYPILLEEQLPEIAIPLLPGDPPAYIDLQIVFDRCYDAGPYAYEIDYATTTPLPPLPSAKAGWAADLVKNRSA